MSRKNNTRSIKKIQEQQENRIDTKRKLERKLGILQNQPLQGKGWNFIPAER